MVNFVCEECSYRFKSESPKVSKKCPYCGRDGIIKEPSAQDLIDE